MADGVRKAGDIVGDYRLEEIAGESERTRTWRADQLSMQRPVMLEMLRQDVARDPLWVAAFLADVRAKALVKHNGIGAVYEAVSDEQGTFFARERLEGESLENLAANGVTFSPVELVKLLHQIAAAMIYLENEGVAMEEPELKHLVLSGGNRIRMMNLAVDGPREEVVSTRLKQRLGASLSHMFRRGEPGATRVGSLLGFMADVDRQVPLTWTQILSLCDQVREQLEGAAPPEPVPPPMAPSVKTPVRIPPYVWALLFGLGLICGLVFFFLTHSDPKPIEQTKLPDSPGGQIEIPAGEYVSLDGSTVTIQQNFFLGRTEVTISEYRDFLEAGNLKRFRHPDQPDTKVGHEPADWRNLWAAAVKKADWEGRPVSTDCPVVGVDWWDAYAYAGWKGGRLPTMNEWSVAAGFKGAPAEVASWGPAKEATGDLTGAGLIGMAGNVREWTREVEVNPAFQLSPKKPVTVGASFLDPAEGAATRTWLDDRSVRASDLGFRILKEK